MKKILIPLLLLVMCSSVVARAEVVLWPSHARVLASEPQSVKVLSINNSLVDYNDQYVMFNNIASAMGKTASWTKHTNLGQTLAYHFNQDPLVPNAKEVVASDVWTHIILQEQSSLPRTDFATFRANVKLWVDYIRAYCGNPNAVIILPVNWPYSDDNSFQSTAATLVANYTKVAQEFGLVLCPICDAYSAYQVDYPSTLKSELYTDNRHPTQAATYLACCLEFAVIYGIDPSAITWKPGAMDASQAATMRTYAKKAYDGFMQVVNHQTQQVKFEIHTLGSNGLSAGLAQSAGVEQFATVGTHTVERTYEGQTLTATVVTGEAVTTKPAQPELPDSAFIPMTSNGTYTQDFNAIGGEDVDPAPCEKTAYIRDTKLPEGWRIDTKTTVRTKGTFAAAKTVTAYIGGKGLANNARNGTWNYGDTGSKERAVGGSTTNTAGGARTISVMAGLHNTSSDDIHSLTISYDVEKYRKGALSAGFTVQLWTSIDGENWSEAGSDFCSVYATDGVTEGSAVVPIETRNVTGSMDVNFPADGKLYLLWCISSTSGQDADKAMAFGIDNVTITPSATSAPPTYVVAITDGSMIVQDFDCLGGAEIIPTNDVDGKTAYSKESTLPVGWKIERNMNKPREVGSYSSASTTTMYVGGKNVASNDKNGTWNFGDTGSSDRAIGGLTTGNVGGSAGTRGVNVMSCLYNNSGADIESIVLSYDVEKYRNGSNAEGFTVQLYTSYDGANWTSAGSDFCTNYTKDNNTNGFETVPASTTYVGGVLNVDFPIGGELYLAWNISVTAGSTCSSAQGLAIDNVSITPAPSVATTADHWASFSSSLDWTIPTGVTAYKADYQLNGENESLVLTALTGGVIPANTGVLLQDSSREVIAGFEVVSDTSLINASKAELEGNELSASVTRTELSDKTNDIFCMHYTAEQGTFFQLYEGAYIPAGSAYLELPAGTPSIAPNRMIRIVLEGNTPTGLESVTHTKEWKKELRNGQLYLVCGEAIYTVEGSRVE